MINRIFHIEGRDPDNPSKKSDYSLEEIAQIRKEKSAQMTADFFKWCEEIQRETLPKSLIGGAIFYALNQKLTLPTFLENPKLELTNNAAESAVKPFVMGRKNWLFCNSPGGANSSAIIYSIIETAKENQLKPYDYLVWLFEKIRSGQYQNIAELLPWNFSIPDNIRMKSDS